MNCKMCNGKGYWQIPSTHGDVLCGNCGGSGRATVKDQVLSPPPLKAVSDMTPAELRAMADRLERATIERAEALLKTVSEDAVVAYLRKLGYEVMMLPGGGR